MSKAKGKAYETVAYAGIPIVGVLFFITHGSRIDPFIVLITEMLLMFGYITAMQDLKTKRIPNGLVLAMFAAWMIVMLPKLFIDTRVAVILLKNSALGFLIGGGMFLLVYVISRKGLGGGDVKFMAASGLYLGIGGVFTTMFYGTSLAALVGIVLILLKRIGRKDSIPLAPFLYIGILITAFTLR